MNHAASTRQNTDRQDLKLTFLGGAGEIGASCCLLQVAGTNLLIDAGIRMKGDSPLPDLGSLAGVHLDAILVTHAHTDHTGALPVVCEAFPGVPIYATPPTIDLVMILTRDALKLMRLGESDGDLPLYNEAQVDKLIEVLIPQPVNQPLDIGELSVRFFPAAHILGAAMLHIATPAGNVLFTGDYSVTAQRTVPALTTPGLPTDLVVTEATYGNRLHEDRSLAENRLLEQINNVLANEGKVLIPAFAIGRAQEILLILKNALRKHLLPEVPVYVDGMVRSVCEVYRRHPQWVCRPLARAIRNEDHPFYTNGIRPIDKPRQREDVPVGGPCVIVASSGMLNGGASAFYASRLVGDSRNAVLLTGYQDEESPGRALLALAGEPAAGPAQRTLNLAGRTVPVHCSFDTFGLSAHADRMQMTALLESLRPRCVVLVHGDQQAKQALASSLSCRDVVAADNGLVLQRAFPVRRGAPPRARSVDFDLDTARGFLGPPSDRPVPIKRLAAAWFGDVVSRPDRETLVARLEEMELIRRDDKRRSLAWILTPGESGSLEDEARFAEQLKQDNPKGRLLELCMRSAVAAPEFETGLDGAFHTVRLQMSWQGRDLDTGPCAAAEKKTAQQLAAARLLEAIEGLEQDQRVIEIDEDEQATLAAANFKGRLLEWRTRHPGASVEFINEPRTDGQAARIELTLPGSATESTALYCAARKVAAEHAAARAALAILEGRLRPAVEFAAGAPATGQVDPTPYGGDPRGPLNEMRQTGVLDGFGYRQVGNRGPTHQPVFVMTAWAQLPAGQELVTAEVEAGSKKAAQLAAARALMRVLEDAGLCGESGLHWSRGASS